MPTNGPLVMVIEDEAPIRRFLRASLTEEDIGSRRPRQARKESRRRWPSRQTS